MGIFDGLESLGFSKLEKVDVYNEDHTGSKSNSTVIIENRAQEPAETDYIFDKTYVCPVCDNEFKSKTVKAGKVHLIGADTDLRPKYKGIDSLKYDAILCPKCGYTALNRYFNYMTSGQARLIRENISKNFKGIITGRDIVSYDEAITKHKLALLNAVVKKSSVSEKAYICLKTAWLLRGKAESIGGSAPESEEKAKLEAEELQFIDNAYSGFMEAISRENFPMCGMDENTVMYLISDLAIRLKKYDEAGRLISRILTSREASERVKSKARELKDRLMEITKEK